MYKRRENLNPKTPKPLAIFHKLNSTIKWIESIWTIKLNSLESNLELEWKDYNHKLEKINASIKDKEERIMELEAMLKKHIDQKQTLEEQKSLLLDNIRAVNQKHSPGIEKAKDLKVRYELKWLTGYLVLWQIVEQLSLDENELATPD